MKWWIWVRIKSTGKQRWAKFEGEHTEPLSLDDAIALCAKWNKTAEKHKYSVRQYKPRVRVVKVIVEIKMPVEPREAGVDVEDVEEDPGSE